jgi:hypothetical protein
MSMTLLVFLLILKGRKNSDSHLPHASTAPVQSVYLSGRLKYLEHGTSQ